MTIIEREVGWKVAKLDLKEVRTVVLAQLIICMVFHHGGLHAMRVIKI